MGWSCATYAADTLDRWYHDIRGQNPLPRHPSNVYTGTDGQSYLIEIGRREHDDGAITGTTYLCLNNGYCRKSGSFRIEPDGAVSRYPTRWPFARSPRPQPAPSPFTATWEPGSLTCTHPGR